MKRLFRSVFDVRRGEVGITVLMVLNIYLLLVTYYFLKPARNALFLARAGSDELPYVFMLIAVVVVPITTIYSQASRRLKLNRLINITTVTLIVNLFVLRWLIEFPHTWVVYTFYIWVSIYGILVTSQFWLLANGIFDATQAKRLFIIFGLAAIIGASTGGEITGLLSTTFKVSIENQLFFCAAFLAASIVLVNAAWARRGQDPRPRSRPHRHAEKEGMLDTFRILKRSRYLMLIVAVIAATMAVSSFTDYQFQTVAAEHYLTADKADVAAFDAQKQQLGAFMGRFFGRMSLLSFLFQFLLSYRFIRFIGVGGVVMFLPLGLVGGSMAMLLAPGLLAGILLRGTDGVLKYSIDKTARELLFLPVPFDLKAKTKIFIDVFVDRWFRGLSGALLALLVALHFTVRHMSIVVMVMLGVWIVFALLVRREYVNAFRSALERRQIDPADLRMNIADASTLNRLRAALGSTNERQIVYALEMLIGVQDAEIVGAIRPLLQHDSADVRRNAVRVVQLQEQGDFSDEMEALLTDEDAEVRRDAMDYLCHHGAGDRMEKIARYLAHDNPLVKSAVLACVTDYGVRAERRMITEDVVEELAKVEGGGSEVVRAQLADAIGALRDARFNKYLLSLMEDPVVGVAERAMEAAGRTGDREFVNRLFVKVGERRFRRAARRGLAAYGDRVVGATTDYIMDPGVDLPTTSVMCRLLHDIGTQHAVDGLVSVIAEVDPGARYHVLKALNKLRARRDDLRFDHAQLRGALAKEVESYFALLQTSDLAGERDDDRARLLARALGEEREMALERIFRFLQLAYPPADIHGAYMGAVSSEKSLRASAIEFLDNLLERDVKRYITPLIDNISEAERIAHGQRLFGVHMSDDVAALKWILQSNAYWLKACAAYTLNADSPPDIRTLVEELRADPHPIVRETAELALSR